MMRKVALMRPLISQPRTSVQGNSTLSATAQSRAMSSKRMAMDGNMAAAHVAYALSDNAFIYPISPSSPMGEHADSWAAKGKKNVFGQVPLIKQMQSEAGAAGALHGALAGGGLSSTFTASQGLLLMIPNMYIIAGELLPSVFHVSARAVSRQALSIFCDHSDVMACRQTGFALLSSHSVQEAMDLGLVAHLASIKSSIPILHFFDGYRTSHEISTIDAIGYEDILPLVDMEAVQRHRQRALNPNHPTMRGTGQRPDVYFQSSIASTPYFQQLPNIIKDAMKDVEKITGRSYAPFQYFGHPEAEQVIVIMGSASKTVEETVTYLNKHGEKVGCLKVHLFRPWVSQDFLSALPPTAKRIAVLDRTKEDGSLGCPLYLDVNTTLMESQDFRTVVGGMYGLAGKEFTPGMVESVFTNLKQSKPRNKFTVGIVDDISGTHLPFKELSIPHPGTVQCQFWGVGSDGTIGANKQAIDIIGSQTGMYTQGYFQLDSHKSGGVTVSHLRFGSEPIKAEYLVMDSDYISVHHSAYMNKFDMIKNLKPGGTFVLNSSWSLQEMEHKLPARAKKQLAEKKARFFNIDAFDLAKKLGLGNRINTIMQAVFFQLSGVLPIDQAIALLNDSIAKAYSKKEKTVIELNQKAVASTLTHVQQIHYPPEWINATDEPETHSTQSQAQRTPIEVAQEEFHLSVAKPLEHYEGDVLPVSKFAAGGITPTGQTRNEKRGIAQEVPIWLPDCSHCNYCSLVCPHAAIRPFLLSKEETTAAPEGFQSRKAKGGSELAAYNYSITVSPLDCTGCGVCVETCPDNTLKMIPIEESLKLQHDKHWEYAVNSVPVRGNLVDKMTVRGSQFQEPLLEFSGACPGCGETPYVKLLTQLFGERMIIANASGCSSVWGGTFGSGAYTTNKKGLGPAWARSLFEDNAEYGLGIALATQQRRQKLLDNVKVALAESDSLPNGMSGELKTLLNQFVSAFKSPEKTEAISKQMEAQLASHVESASLRKESSEGQKRLDSLVKQIYDTKDLFVPPTHWIIGGDGWAYDIGFGGVDHALASGANVKLLVLDNEMYANTGGQMSKATPIGAMVKYAASGKGSIKKDLGMMAMSYQNVYVASISLGANFNQTLQALKEAEAYDGPALILAFSPCIDWGMKYGVQDMVKLMKQAVDSGYWPLYRFDPRKLNKPGVNAFQLDSKKIKEGLTHFLERQNRFSLLQRTDKERAKALHESLSDFDSRRHERLQRAAMDDVELLEKLKKFAGESTGDKMLILYGSETGNAEEVAKNLANHLKRCGVRTQCIAADEYEFGNLPEEKTVIMIVSTAGQGELPVNCKLFYQELTTHKPTDYLKNTSFAVFGLGDSNYVFFNKAAETFDKLLGELGAKRIAKLGLGDDQAAEKYETALEEWMPDFCNEAQIQPPKTDELPPPTSQVSIVTKENAAGLNPEVTRYIPPTSQLVNMTTAKVMTPADYDRDIRHFEFDLKGTGLSYNVGDALAIFPHNPPEDVKEFLSFYGLRADDLITIKDLTGENKKPLPSVMTANTLFGQVLDMFGRPKRRFYETLSIIAKNDADKKELKHLISKEGKKDFQELVKETVTYFDVLKMFPSAVPDPSVLVESIPPIKPRLYSIASSPSFVGKDKLDLCIISDDWTTPSGRYRHGLCTKYLRNLNPSASQPIPISCRVNPAVSHMPPSYMTPVIMVGLGTGLAPFRAMIQERVAARQRGEKTGPMALVFGARHKASEYLYGDELEEYMRQGIITGLFTAFSRDQAEKVYVQNRLTENPKLVHKYLFEGEGYFYYCGQAGQVPKQVRAAIVSAISSEAGISKDEAEKYVVNMQLNGRYNVEAW